MYAGLVRGRLLAAGLALAACLSLAPAGADQPIPLPTRLSDQEFWRMIDDFSEPSGFFRSETLVSNEDAYQTVIPEIQRLVRPGGIYVGVGPDQNFSYIAAFRPAFAFIPDIRRGNLQLHLMYKALFEISADRADFLSRLFSRRRPVGLGSSSSASQLFGAYAFAASDRTLYETNLREIIEHLTKARGIALDQGDLDGVTSVYGSFFAAGPDVAYSNTGPVGRTRYPTYQDLQLATDRQGVGRAYLATEEAFRFVRAMEASNRIVPLVGNFAGPRAIRAVATWLRERDARVSVFYTSNVEQYLFQDGRWADFAQNVALLPQSEASMFIRSCFGNCSSGRGSRAVTLIDSIPGLLEEHRQGRILGYLDVLSHSRR
jgi:hypothetical protein